MRKSFKEILSLSPDKFSAYFNNRIAVQLGKRGLGAVLTTEKVGRIKEIRRELYEKLKSIKKPSFMATSPAELYFALENDYLDAAIHALKKPSRAPAAGAGARAAVSETSSLGFLKPDSVRGIASYLLPQEQVALAKVSKPLNTDLKGALDPERVKAIKKFLHHVARGQQAEAEAMC